MLIRLVRMTFRPDRLADFSALFEEFGPRIREFPGCRRLELWEDLRYPNVLTTYSVWDSEEALDRYRRSELFRATWEVTRKLFAAPAEARSHRPVEG